MNLFNTGMKNLWNTRVYVDLFAGPGVCVDRYSGQEFEGSPIRALNCKTPFTHLFFNDSKPDIVNALKARQLRMFPDANVFYSALDCNEAAPNIGRQLPGNALTLVFIDPWNYELNFQALSLLARRSSIDLIVTFHTTAIKRNARLELEEVDLFLGDTEWRNRFFAAKGDVSNSGTKVIIESFKSNLKNRLGYKYFGDPEPIRNEHGNPIFYLLFASHNARGLDFWEKSSYIKASGQRAMF